ncbi:MAG: sigma-54 dependent transcriptional regulator, partial [Pseudomonadota bacterium]
MTTVTDINMKPIKLVVVDDDVALADSLQHFLQRANCQVRTFKAGAKALEAVSTDMPDAVISDLRMPGMSGLELQEALRQRWPQLPLILITAHGDVSVAVEAMRQGAFDFIEKPFDPEHLLKLTKRAVQLRRLGETNQRLRTQVGNLSGLEKSIIGNSQAIRHLREEISEIAGTDASVLICGETGTGKEVVARNLHNLSARQGAPFVGLNCAAIPEQLFEATLFGHTAGAFTGATKSSKGLFLEADSGTLFLDELTSLPISLQPKLLRALEEREVLAVGSTKATSFDARLISAANQTLDSLIDKGEFRDDLYYRLNTVIIEIPPLRSRNDDVTLLFINRMEKFGQHYNIETPQLNDEDLAALMSHEWPGNVRELESVAERLILACRRGPARVKDVLQNSNASIEQGETLRDRVDA